MNDFDHYAKVRLALSKCMRSDLEWIGRRTPCPAEDAHLPWMPFQAADFVALLAEAIAESSGSRFLDVGCGIGTKMRLARDIFGLAVNGVEINPYLLDYAYGSPAGMGGMGLPAGALLRADALKVLTGYYSHFDIIWMYRPFRDPKLQQQLEQRIFTEARTGAIVLGGAWETQPEGWQIVVDDWDTGHRGAWKKPWKP